jgi:hypothetical protein
MPKLILDEIAKLPVSRQRKWQLRQKEKRLCLKCTKPAVTKIYCLEHAVSIREGVRNKKGARRRNQALSYQLEKTLVKDHLH